MAKADLDNKDWAIIKNALADSLKTQERQAKAASNELIKAAHEGVALAIRNTQAKL